MAVLAELLTSDPLLRDRGRHELDASGSDVAGAETASSTGRRERSEAKMD